MCVFVYINVYTKYIIYNIYNLKIYNGYIYNIYIYIYIYQNTKL